MSDIFKTITISFLAAVGYIGFSWLYFSSDLSNTLSESEFFGIFDLLLSLPGLVMFGYGFGGGQSAMVQATFYMFLIIWFIAFLITYVIQTIRKNNSKLKSD